jgi:predicted transposase YbfD/YdcC
MQKVQKDTKGAVVAIDGKQFHMQPSVSDKKGNPLYIVSAWCQRNGMTLAHQKVDAKTNEIKGIPLLLKCLKVPGSIITIDAIGCQREIVTMIRRKNRADYCIALNKNQGTLYDEMVRYAQDCLCDNLLKDKYSQYVTMNKGHGRLEKRKYTLFNDLSWFHDLKKWEGLRGLVCVESTRTIKNITSTDVRYYITSLVSVEETAKAIRSHWGIENNLHWVLDVVFREDHWHTRIENAAANLATVRKLALTFLRKSNVDLPIKQPITGPMKVFACALDHKILERVLLSTNVFS